MNIEHLAHDLFLLMLNLSQLQSSERMLAIFVDALNRAQDAVSLRLLTEGEHISDEAIQIATAQNSFGWIVLEGKEQAQSPELLSLIRNAIHMLALVLENRVSAQLLADDRSRLEKAVAARTSELHRTNLAIQAEIVERTRIEDALREKTEALDRYFTLSLDLLCIADTDGFFHRLNPEWERTLGYRISELEGKRFF